MNEFFTWETLATLAGASVATGIFVQFLKEYIPIATQVLSYLVALVILVAANIFTGVLSPGDYALCIFNAVIVSGAASNTAAFLQRLQGKE